MSAVAANTRWRRCSAPPTKSSVRRWTRCTPSRRVTPQTAPEALQRLQAVAASGGNVFAELLETVQVCSLGQITRACTR